MVSSGRGVGCPQSPQSFCQPQCTSWSWSWAMNSSRLMRGKSYLTNTHFFFHFQCRYYVHIRDDLWYACGDQRIILNVGPPLPLFLWKKGPLLFAMRTDQQAPKYVPVNSSYLTVVALKWQINAITTGFYIHSGDWSLSLHTCKTRALSTERSL